MTTGSSRRRRTTTAVLATFAAMLAAPALAAGTTPEPPPVAPTEPAGTETPAVPVTPPTTTPPTTTPEVTEGEVTIHVTGQTPAVVLPDDVVRLTGTVSNGTDQPFVDPEVVVGVQQAVPLSHGEMLRWFDVENPPRARTEWRSTLPLSVGPGQSVAFTLDIPVNELQFPIRSDNWGARGLQVALATDDALALVRTTAVFYPDPADTTAQDVPVDPLAIAVLLPATPTAAEWSSALTLATATDPGAGTPTVTAPGTSPSGAEITPAVLDTAAAFAVSRVAPMLSAPVTLAVDPVLAARLAALEGAGQAHLIALPWADSDLGQLPLIGADGESLLAQAVTLGTRALATSGLRAASGVAWPSGPEVSQDVVADLLDLATTGLVLEADALPDDDASDPSDPTAATTPSRVDLTVGRSTVRALAADEAFSAAVAGDLDALAVENDAVDDDVLARQLLVALATVTAREGEATPEVLAVLDRDLTAALDAPATANVVERVSVLDGLPWVDVVPLTELLAVPATRTIATADLADVSVPAARERTIAEAIEQQQHVTALACAFDSPGRIASLSDLLVLTGSTAWRLAGQDGSAVTQVVAAELAEVTDGISVTVPSGVNLAAEEGAIPVTITNTLDVPLTVHIEITPDQPALRVEDTPDVRLEGGTSQTIRVAVVAIASGQATLDVAVTSPGGAVLGTAAAFDVRVRAEWEGAAVGIAAAGLAVVLVVGLIRTIRRGRRGRDGVAPDTVDPAEPELQPELEP